MTQFFKESQAYAITNHCTVNLSIRENYIGRQYNNNYNHHNKEKHLLIQSKKEEKVKPL